MTVGCRPVDGISFHARSVKTGWFTFSKQSLGGAQQTASNNNHGCRTVTCFNILRICDVDQHFRCWVHDTHISQHSIAVICLVIVSFEWLPICTKCLHTIIVSPFPVCIYKRSEKFGRGFQSSYHLVHSSRSKRLSIISNV